MPRHVATSPRLERPRGLHVAAAGSNINGPSSAPKFDRPMERRRGVIMMKRLLLILLALAMAAGLTPLAMWQAHAAGYADPRVARPLSVTAAPQGTTTVVIAEPYTLSTD